ncbi:hypothetical protein M0R45_016384 [Rubus argutus]|uniref:Uncharacterized protein n=1 Tax=Rubus argutus TaxID=59490 RepID=A0AAW1XSF0_RUBAR
MAEATPSPKPTEASQTETPLNATPTSTEYFTIPEAAPSPSTFITGVGASSTQVVAAPSLENSVTAPSLETPVVTPSL